MKQCEYKRTVSGSCNQTNERGSDYCFYHNQVKRGLIEPTDEVQLLKDLPEQK